MFDDSDYFQRPTITDAILADTQKLGFDMASRTQDRSHVVGLGCV